MSTLAERPGLRLFTLCALYTAQGIPWGFTAITLPAYLAHKGWSPEYIGATLSMTTLPYAFKWIWAPIIDAYTIKRFGRRRPWIVFAQLMMALTIGAMLLIPKLDDALDTLALLVFVHTIFNSMQDVAVDGLAVDLLTDDERGRANGLMYGCKYGGGIIGGAGMATLIASFSMRAALVTQVVLLLAIMMLPLLLRERPTAPTKLPSLGKVLGSLGQVFRLRSALLGGVVMLTANLSAGVLATISVVLFTQELGWEYQRYAQITGGPGLVLGLLGSVAGGFIADRFGARRVAAAACVTMAALWLLWAATRTLWTNDAYVYTLFLVEPLTQGMMTVALFSLCMKLSWPVIAATQFTTYMAFSNVSSTIGFRIAGRVGANLDYPKIYVMCAVVQLCVAALLPLIDPEEVRRELPDQPP